MHLKLFLPIVVGLFIAVILSNMFLLYSGIHMQIIMINDLIMLVVGGFVLMIIYIFIKKSLSPISAFNDVLDKAYSNGQYDLSIRFANDKQTSDALGQLQIKMNNYLNHVENEFTNTLLIIADASENTIPIAQDSIQVKDTISHANLLSSNIVTAGEEMGATIAEISSNVYTSADQVSKTKDLIHEGNDSIQNTIQVSNEVSGFISKLTTQISELQENASSIEHIISVINDISDQTNLLALNAAIEAARAGEAGRGFAVVADEVRKLAEKTTSSTQEIEGKVSQMLNDIRIVSAEAENVSHQISVQGDVINHTYEIFDRIMNNILSVDSNVSGISTSIEQQNAATQEIVQNINVVSNMSESAESSSISLIDDTDLLSERLQEISGNYSKMKMSSKSTYFAIAKIAHVNFMKRIFDYISKNKSIDQLPNHHTCAFGKFYYGVGKEIFGNDNLFKSIEPEHILVHERGQEVVNHLKEHGSEGIDDKFQQLNTSVTNLVEILNQLIDKYR